MNFTDVSNFTLPNYESVTLTAEELIKFYCAQYNNTLIYGIFILAVLFIILEIFYFTKYKQNIIYIEIKNYIYFLMGFFLVYEGYYFLVNILTPLQYKISRYIIFIFMGLMIILLFRNLYKYIKQSKLNNN